MGGPDMGSNSMQAQALLLFLTAAVLLAAGISLGGKLLLLGAGIVVLVASVALFVKSKPLEQSEEE
jgi:membrane-bound ClpP family serine protease